MLTYELLLVLPGTLDEIAAETRSREIEAVVNEHGSDTRLTAMGKNRLAYPVKQIRYGYFYTLVFRSEATAVKALEQKLSLVRDLLRTMITYFNTDVATLAKVSYATNGAGVTTMTERVLTGIDTDAMPGEKLAAVAPKKEEKPADLEEINKKLDDILSGDNIIPGV